VKGRTVWFVMLAKVLTIVFAGTLAGGELKNRSSPFA